MQFSNFKIPFGSFLIPTSLRFNIAHLWISLDQECSLDLEPSSPISSTDKWLEKCITSSCLEKAKDTLHVAPSLENLWIMNFTLNSSSLSSRLPLSISPSRRESRYVNSFRNELVSTTNFISPSRGAACQSSSLGDKRDMVCASQSRLLERSPRCGLLPL